MEEKNNKNNKQDIQLAKVEQWQEDFNITWGRFLDNDFGHLQKKVNWLFILIVAGMLVPIVLYIIQYK